MYLTVDSFSTHGMAKRINSKKVKNIGKTTKIRLRKLFSPAKLQATLLRYESIPVFGKNDLRRLLGLSVKQTERALSEALAEGVLVRIKPGLFGLSVRLPSAFALANYLVSPSYISLESALSYHRIIPETVYAVTSVTPKFPKRFNRLNRDFAYHRMNRNLFFGYNKISIGGVPILMADKEKAVLDYLYFVVRGLRKVNQRSDFSKLDKDKLASYLIHFRNALKGRKRVAYDNLLKTLNIV